MSSRLQHKKGDGNTSFQDLDLGFNVVTFGKYGCNTNTKNDKNHDVSWWFSLKSVEDKNKSIIYGINQSFKITDDKIDPTSFLIEKVNSLFDAFNYQGGFDIDGNFRNQNDDIVSQEEGLDEAMSFAGSNEFAVFVFQSEYKDKVYTNVYHKIYPARQMEKLENEVNEAIQKNYLKLYDPNLKKKQGPLGRASNTGGANRPRRL